MDHLHHENRAKTSCSAPTNSRYKLNVDDKSPDSALSRSRSPSQHRSRSTSAALRQASVMSGDPGSGLTIGPNAWLKRKLHLRPQHRGVHLVTEEILAGLPELSQFQVRKMKYKRMLVNKRVGQQQL